MLAWSVMLRMSGRQESAMSAPTAHFLPDSLEASPVTSLASLWEDNISWLLCQVTFLQSSGRNRRGKAGRETLRSSAGLNNEVWLLSKRWCGPWWHAVTRSPEVAMPKGRHAYLTTDACNWNVLQNSHPKLEKQLILSKYCWLKAQVVVW